MGCSNCFNGCAEIVSDQCVKYTGIDVPVLGIQKGDSLSYVEQALIEFLTSTLDGTGIKIDIPSEIICELVQQYLPDCGDITVVDLITALIKASCDLQGQVDAVVASITTLNADYDVDCLSGVTNSSDTHAVLQAVIDKLCGLEVDLTALALDVDTNYVKLSELNSLIAAYLASAAITDKYYTKMVPYTALEYYGQLSGFPTMSDGFSPTGVGYGYWEKIYLCNGLNGTPDKRGRVPVGVTNGMGGGAFDPEVDPVTPGNPTYSLNDTYGTNTVTLTSSQIPGHTHPATATITDPGHKHDIWGITGGDNQDNSNTVRFAGGDKNQGETGFYFTNTDACQLATTGLNSSNVAIAVNNNVGGGSFHNNAQPALACYYIMYIP